MEFHFVILSNRNGRMEQGRNDDIQSLEFNRQNKCAVIISGLADLFRSEENRRDFTRFIESCLEVMMKMNTERKKERSAVYFADKINKSTKILLIHGTADNKISYLDSKDMYEKLKNEGVNCELMIIDGGTLFKKTQKRNHKIRRKWFEKYLKK